MLSSIVIRTFNEQKHLAELLEAIKGQAHPGIDKEVVLVDSGSTDGTLDIADKYNCHILHIDKHDFSFGRSLNRGCDVAQGENLVFISGHCIPQHRNWLETLLRPLIDGSCSYVYGRQIGNGASKFSEQRLFGKFYPETSRLPQEGFFCNNANAAVKKSVWSAFRFDEELTGLEDMELAKRLVGDGYSIGYAAEAPVFHIHEESWHMVRLRYEREAIALQKIMPEVQVNFPEALRYFVSSLFFDVGAALRDGVLLSNFREIFMFRLMQYWGTYKGNHEHRRMSQELKENYFYPR